MKRYNDHTVHDIQQMRQAIYYMGLAKNCYLDAGRTVEALSIGTTIGVRRKELDEFISNLTTTQGENYE